MTDDIRLTPETLRRFSSFRTIPEDDLLVLAHQLELRRAGRDTTLIEHGDTSTTEIFLLRGEVELVAEDGRVQNLAADDPAALVPLARLRPRKFTVRALTPLTYFELDGAVIGELGSQTLDAGLERDDYGIAVIDIPADEREEMLDRFRQDLRAKRFTLSSLPEVAIKIRAALQSDDADFSAIAQVVNRDPAIAAKLVKAANSPIFHGSNRCDTVVAAISRLGLVSTRQLVYSFTMRDLFKSDASWLKQRMAAAWAESVDVAAISAVLARHTNLVPPGEALLAGLLANIGTVSVLNYAGNHADEFGTEELLQRLLMSIKAEVGALVLEAWSFPPEFVEVARGVEDWQRSPADGPDLCDLVQVAVLHAYMGKRRKPAPPRLDQVPAFARLTQGRFTPETSLQLLSEANEEIRETRALLSL